MILQCFFYLFGRANGYKIDGVNEYLCSCERCKKLVIAYCLRNSNNKFIKLFLDFLSLVKIDISRDSLLKLC